MKNQYIKSFFNISLILLSFLALFLLYKRKYSYESFRIRTYGSSTSDIDLTDETTLIIFSTFISISGLLLLIGIGYAVYLSYYSSEISY
jgi:hypothetical protein